MPQNSTDVADSIKKIFSGGLIGDLFTKPSNGTSEADAANAIAVKVVNFPEQQDKGGISGIFGKALSVFGFAEGGEVPRDMLALVHKNEMVLPPAIAQSIRSVVHADFNPRLPSVPSVIGSGAQLPTLPQTFATNQSSTIGEVKITVNGAQKPQETAREIARYLKSLSPKFSPAT